jgi:hypothetical protein
MDVGCIFTGLKRGKVQRERGGADRIATGPAPNERQGYRNTKETKQQVYQERILWILSQYCCAP